MKLNTLIPELTVLNIDVSLNFYTKILGQISDKIVNKILKSNK